MMKLNKYIKKFCPTIFTNTENFFMALNSIFSSAVRDQYL